MSGTRNSGASRPSRWFGGRGSGRRSATREGAGRPCFVMEDVQLLVLLRLFSKRPSYRISASGIEEDHHDCFFFHAIVQNWVRMNSATEVMLIPRILYVLLSPGDYFEWLCETVETREAGSVALTVTVIARGSSNFLFIRLPFDKMFPDVRTGHTFARLDVFLLMHFIASCYMLCLLCFVAYHLFLSGEIMIHASIAVSNLHKNAKKSFSETIKDMYLHYNERSGLLLCGFQI
uniref:Uncharacterized protein n=1 Tax=Aegilops tauschii TaxID=37682 RepID=M8CCM5_AEGTA